MRKLLLALPLIGIALACSPSAPAQSICPEPDPTPIYDGGDDDGAAALASPCGRACSRLRELHCPEGDPSSSGVSCYAVCRRAGDALNPSCVERATSAADLARCNVRCQR